MCGRFTQYTTPQEYAAMFGIDTDLQVAPSYNVAPTDAIIACRLDDENNRTLSTLHWGLIPSWSKGPDKRFSMINARAESIAEKPAYRTPFRKHRCLIPADGFYEWHVEKYGKQPYYIHRDDDQPLVFAGVWDHWKDEEGDRIDSCAIITCDANKQMQAIHERMPVILSRRQWDAWLTDSNTLRLQDMLVPYPHEHLAMHPVSLKVNSPSHDGAELIKPV